MEKEVYDYVGKASVFLKAKLEELEACQKEKEEILRIISELEAKDELEEKYPEIKERMDKNLRDFQKVVNDIKKLKDVDAKGR